ncbi:MAG: hypothetical protein IJT65_01560 [Eubacterium sp.]|nr:hypothetical protein [Eubacterium sp.]
MKKVFKAVICIALCAVFAFSLSGCAKVSYVFDGTLKAVSEVKSGEWNKKDKAEDEGDASSDPAVIDELKPGTYGGIEFKTLDDVANYYAEAYKITKAETAEYIDENGKKATFYKFIDEKRIEVNDILVEGSSNAVINKLIPQLLDALYVPTIGGLHPCNAREPENDKDEKGGSLLESRIKGDDLTAANVKDNGDGTITLTMQPKLTEMSRVGMDPQGKMFTTLNDIGAVVDAVDAFSWASGTTEENCKVTYKGGTAVIKIDTKTKKVVEADYTMIAYVDIQHANIAVVHDKSLSATVYYKCHFPCSKEFLEKVNVKPVN